jgi:hypothetical protein
MIRTEEAGETEWCFRRLACSSKACGWPLRDANDNTKTKTKTKTPRVSGTKGETVESQDGAEHAMRCPPQQIAR